MVEEQKYPYLTWRLVLEVASRSLKSLKIVVWSVIVTFNSLSVVSMRQSISLLGLSRKIMNPTYFA